MKVNDTVCLQHVSFFLTVYNIFSYRYAIINQVKSIPSRSVLLLKHMLRNTDMQRRRML
jgi:hypothetical protein